MAKRNRKGQFVKGGGGGGGGRKRSRSTHSTALARTSTTRVVHVKAAPRRRARGGGGGGGTSHLWGPVLMGAALGFAKKQGWEIPAIGELGEDATLAVGGYLLLKFNVVPGSLRKHVANATLAAAVLAAHEIGQSGSIPGLKKKGGGGKTEGAGPQHNYEIK